MNGIGVCPGIAIGKACVIKKNDIRLTGIKLLNEAEIATEVSKYNQAMQVTKKEIQDIIRELEQNNDIDSMQIMEAHLDILEDPQLDEEVLDRIKKQKKDANDSVIEAVEEIARMFEEMDNEYLKTRAADIKDIGNRILKNFNHSGANSRPRFCKDEIVIADDISPSDSLEMGKSEIAGFATSQGGKTSHSAIIAKSKGLPAVVGCGPELKKIQDGDTVILDGSAGLVLVNPDQKTFEEYTGKREEARKEFQLLQEIRDVPAITTDDVHVGLMANILSPDEINSALDYGCEGVGLLRTEMLFLNRKTMPDEEEQFNFYKEAGINSRGKPVVVRTIDIGGDKQVPFLGLKNENNPFLGYRAIRICLKEKEVFKIQLRAILRASVFGKLEIMFPMISSVQEVREAKSVLNEVKEELSRKGIEFDDQIKVGIMIEIPSAAVTADILAKEVDFFSIGTNDLCQYTLAVDRMNEDVKYLYDPFNPGVLRLIQNVIEQAHKNRIRVGMCGEFASDPRATILLLGMGLDEFSMSASSIPYVKNIILKHSKQEAQKILQAVMKLDSSSQIKEYLQEVQL